MAVVVPCITAGTPEDYKFSLENIHLFTKRVHIDMSDGSFAPNQLIGLDKIWWPEGWEVDIHAMVAQPSLYLDQMLALRPHMIILHAEAQEDLVPLLQKIKQAGVRAGVSLVRTTVPADVVGLIQIADHVMIFSGNLGKYGGTASLMQLEKIRLVKNINAAAEIGWDGGITVENAFSLAQGGVDVFNVGGAIQKADDAQAAYDALVKEVSRQGAM